jgi:hypothetical protein
MGYGLFVCYSFRSCQHHQNFPIFVQLSTTIIPVNGVTPPNCVNDVIYRIVEFYFRSTAAIQKKHWDATSLNDDSEMAFAHDGGRD